MRYTNTADVIAERNLDRAAHAPRRPAGANGSGSSMISATFTVPELEPEDMAAARANLIIGILGGHGCTGAGCTHPKHPGDVADLLRLLDMTGLTATHQGAAS